MNGPLLVLSLLLVFAQFALPRRLAFVPLLIAACHTPYYATIGGQFSAVRLVLLAGLIRATCTGLLDWHPRKPLDLLMAVWSGIALLSALGHETGNPLTYRAGLVLNVLGTFLYGRAYLREHADFVQLIRATAIVLIPLAAFLTLEAATGANSYAAIGSRFSFAITRDDQNRAMGPFGTPILAGTIGAVCFPLFVALWHQYRRTAFLGIVSSFAIISASASSGPIGTFLLGTGALFLWRWRTSLGKVKLAALALIAVIQLFRERSVLYLIAIIDFVGGSTGWHRSRLLESSLEHLEEWWFMGTDYTRHWMPYGLPSVPEHCDLTSYYVHLGVIGGLPLTLTLIALVFRSFNLLGRRIRAMRAVDAPEELLLWCAGCTLFAHAITFFTISYFDQLYVFFYLLLAAVPCLMRPTAAEIRSTPPPPAPVEMPAPALPVFNLR
jgi:hypothetical protein